MASIATFIIEENGDLTFLVTPAAAAFVTPDAVVSRASHVEPDNILLRIVFRILRTVLGDKGRMSEFTRSWPCLWRVNTAPVGGPVLTWKHIGGDSDTVARFSVRQNAIDAEVIFLNKFFEEKI